MSKHVNKRFKHLLDVRRLKKVCEKREKENREKVTLNFQVEKTSLNLEEMFRADMIGKHGFIVDTSARYEKQGADAGLIDLDTILSYKFGVKESDPASVKEKRYTCECETDNIKATSGEYCPKCKTYAVEHKYIRGWICINNFKVFNPDLLAVFIKNRNKKKELKKASNYRPDRTEVDRYPWLSNPDFRYNIYNLQNPDTLKEFIIEYSQPKYLDYFLSKLDSFMTSKIPVVSKNHRHHQVITKLDGTPDIRSHEINKYLILINNKVDDLNESSGYMSSGKIIKYLSDINKGYSAIYDNVMSIIGDGKSSDFRGRIGGRRKGSSAKVVIESMLSPVSHECTLSYASFGIMFLDWHYELFVKHGLTAESEFRIRQMFPSKDDYVMMTKVLGELQTEDLAWVTCYRPPALYKSSMQGLYISGLTADGCIRVTEIALGVGMKGDKDGDQMLMFALDPSIRLSFGFAFNGRRDVYDPITGTIRDAFELPESVYFLTYSLFPDEVELDDIVEKERVKINDKRFKISDDYGMMYDQDKVNRNIDKLNR